MSLTIMVVLAALVGAVLFLVYWLGAKSHAQNELESNIDTLHKDKEARDALDKEFNLRGPADVIAGMRDKIEND